MDNLCHTLTGAALGRAGLNRTTRFGSATLMIASNLPDLDVLVFATGESPVAFRRGWTHGVLAQMALPLVLAAVMAIVARRRSPSAGEPPLSVPGLILLSYAGVFLHVFMDFLNNYGVRLLMPFERRWFYGDTLFIIDPWLWLMLGAGVWLAGRQRSTRPARAAVLAAGLYICAMLVSARAARSFVEEAWTAANGSSPRALMVGPVAVSPLHRTVILDTGSQYATGTFTWLPPEVRFDPQPVPKGDADPRVAAARWLPAISAFLIWSRFPVWTVEETEEGTVISVGDMRFAGASAPPFGRGRFAASAVIR